MKSIKKILLSAFVVIAFVAYSVQQRHESTSSMVITPKEQIPQGTPAASSSNSTPVDPTSPPSSSSTATTPNAYKDGSYTGKVADAFYGNIQVKVIIQNGKITDVQFLEYPNDRPNSVAINTQAMPLLRQETIQAQNTHVDIISGATDTSTAFIQSLSSALAKAR